MLKSTENVGEAYEAYLPFCPTEQDAAILKSMLQQQVRLTACIVCGTSIEQSYGGQTRRYCDRAGCRKRGSRIMRRFQRWCWERKTKARLQQYWQELLPDSQQELEKLLQSKWITTEADDGTISHRSIDIADTVTRMLDAERRAAWRKVERYTVVFEQRAERAEERVKELEQELEALRQLLPGALREEIEKQPRYVNVIDSAPVSRVLTIAPAPDESEVDPDRAHTLAVLAQMGVKPLNQMSRAELEARANGEAFEEDEEE